MTNADKIAKIAHLAVMVSTTTDKAVFFNYSGHVNMPSLRIAADKQTYEMEFDDHITLAIEGQQAKLDDWIKRLESLLPVGV